jgi:formylglycine-generating enzyme required for sulfatase activity
MENAAVPILLKRPVFAALVAVLAATPAVAEDMPVPATVSVPAGPSVQGSDRAERELAYRLDEEAYGHSITRERGWYENEPRRTAETAAFEITVTPITNAQYAVFLGETGRPWPDVDAKTWAGYRLIHPYSRSRRHAWGGPLPPAGRADHPVVMVAHADAVAFAAWLSRKTGLTWRLPTEAEWEKAARGSAGRVFPWGDDFDPTRLNSHDLGPFDTIPVGAFPAGASPYGLLDGAGQVYEWTSTAAGAGRHIVKGGSWDDKGCGTCRPAGRHSRPDGIKHILIGFRLVLDALDSAE